jgi:hypothetical protein
MKSIATNNSMEGISSVALKNAMMRSAEKVSANNPGGYAFQGFVGTNFDLIDPAEVLPGPARDTLLAMRTEKDSSFAISRTLSDQRNEIMRDIVLLNQQATQYRTRLRGIVHLTTNDEVVDQNGELKPHPELFKLKSKIEANKREAERLGAAITKHSAIANPLGRILDNCERYVRDAVARGEPLKMFDGAVPKARKGATSLDALNETRAAIAALVEEKRRVDRAPLPSASAKSVMRARIEALAENGRPDVRNLLNADYDPRIGELIGWPLQPKDHLIVAKGDPIVTRINPNHAPHPMFFWLHRDSLIKALEDEIDARSNDSEAMLPDERASAYERIERELLATERAEEHWVRAALADGHAVTRNERADPRALLGLA